jgi:predicted DNA-binding protein YlxM (UPF0122 family)
VTFTKLKKRLVEKVGLTETEFSRLARHLYDDQTLEYIGQEDGCSHQAVRDSIQAGLKKIADAGLDLPIAPRRKGRNKTESMDPDTMNRLHATGSGTYAL